MNDRYRPVHHLSPVSGWLNDPNGPIQIDGTYHVFAQFNPTEAVHGNIHWAHWTSTDLVDWSAQPIALTPGTVADGDGCWSGSAIVHDGEIVLVYSGYRAGERYQSVCVARPRGDGSWVADPEPVLRAPPAELGAAMMRDPFLWRRGDEVRMLLGSGDAEGHPMALVFSSTDLGEWRYVATLCVGSHPAFADVSTGTGWECPHLLQRDGHGVLIMSAWSPPAQLDGVFWAAGEMDGDRLEPRLVGRVDYGPDFYAADLFLEESGATVMWAWSWEAREPAAVESQGWAGLLCAPRLVELTQHGLPVFTAASHLLAARAEETRSFELPYGSSVEKSLDQHAGLSFDVEARFTASESGRAWVAVLVDEHGSERTEIGFDAAAGEVYLDRNNSSTDPTSAKGRFSMPVARDRRDTVDVRILVDVSIIEVFADGKSLTARVYPTALTSTSLLFGTEGSAGVSLTLWKLRPRTVQGPINPPEPAVNCRRP